MDSTAQVRRRLSSLVGLTAVFDHLVEACRAARVGLVVKGSLKTGPVDRFSDIDMALIVPQEASQYESWVRARLEEQGRIVARFPATHLGLDWLWIYFLDRAGEVVKVDVGFINLEQFRRIPDGQILVDPRGELADIQATTAPGDPFPPLDFPDLYHKFSGWIWYTYSKIARGEWMEAYDSLAVMRSWALLPSLQTAHGLPREGFRRLEDRLSKTDYERLENTLPKAVERTELMRCLNTMCEFFVALQPSVLKEGEPDHRQADLEYVVQCVQGLEGEKPTADYDLNEAAATGVFHHELLPRTQRFESALGFRLGPEMTHRVRRLRQQLRVAPVDGQLPPHLTVLYLGRLDGARLAQLHQHLSVLKGETCTVRFGNLDTFFNDERRHTLHLPVTEERGLRTLHRRALALCEELGHRPQSDYIGDHYTPHVSIYRDVDLTGVELTKLATPPSSDGSIELSELYLMSRQLGTNEE